jgi:hypothetical protein
VRTSESETTDKMGSGSDLYTGDRAAWTLGRPVNSILLVRVNRRIAEQKEILARIAIVTSTLTARTYATRTYERGGVRQIRVVKVRLADWPRVVAATVRARSRPRFDGGRPRAAVALVVVVVAINQQQQVAGGVVPAGRRSS